MRSTLSIVRLVDCFARAKIEHPKIIAGIAAIIAAFAVSILAHFVVGERLNRWITLRSWWDQEWKRSIVGLIEAP